MKLTKLMAVLLMSFSAALMAAPFAYVPNEGSGTISIIDTQTDATVGEIAIGGKPRGIAISPDGKRRVSMLMSLIQLPRNLLKKYQ